MMLRNHSSRLTVLPGLEGYGMASQKYTLPQCSNLRYMKLGGAICSLPHLFLFINAIPCCNTIVCFSVYDVDYRPTKHYCIDMLKGFILALYDVFR